MKVHVRQKSSAATHAVRIMELRLQPDAIVKNEEKSRDAIQPRTLHHYAFRHWPDHGTPSAAALLDFLLDVKVCQPSFRQSWPMGALPF